MKTVLAAALVALALGCTSDPDEDATPDIPGGQGGTDGVTPDAVGDETVDGTDGAPDVPACEPDCTDGVCAPNGCGGACPACGDLPVAYGTSCQLNGTPPAPGPVAFENAYPNLVFNYPVHIAALPNGRILIVEKRGVIKSLPDDPAATGAQIELFLDIEGKVNSGPSEAGLLSVALHPKFSENKTFFVNYTATVNSKLTTVVSRMLLGGDGIGDPATEERLLLIEQPYSNHNGGQIAFGPDGMLYVGMGDGGAGGDPGNRSQDLGELLGKMLRIDVDATPAAGKKYAVPADNPFVGVAGAKPEIWAFGLRNPWRFSFDPLTGQLWTADVGQDLWEEVDIIEKGKNYGWKIMEGAHCFKSETCDQTGLTLPIVEYSHNSQGDASTTGGFVYRGKAMPALQGAYVFGDYVFGEVYAARFDDAGKASMSTLAVTDQFITTFGETSTGEILMARASPFSPDTGTVLRLVAAAEGEPPGPAFPRKLSETGCFTDLKALTPAPGLLPYDVNVALWHDGAASVRFLALPDGGKLVPNSDTWELPVGTRLIKTFTYDQPGGGRTVLETRFVIVRDDGIGVYTYRWNDEGTDAELLDSAAERHFLLGDEERTWHFPSRQECLSCHNEAASRTLGWSTAQLDRGVTLGAVTGSQLDLWGQLGILASTPESVAPFPKLDDETVSVASRAGAALDVNCANCHRPGGPPVTDHDLRYGTALATSGICNEDPLEGSFGVEGEKLLVPGEPDKSNLLLRMKTLGELRMPGNTRILDQQAIQLVTDWIAGLPGCQ